MGRPGWAAAAILGVLTGCSTPQPPSPSGAPATPRSAPPLATPATPTPPPQAAAAPGERRTLLRERSRWVSADWAELPGWGDDAVQAAWPALLRGCEKPAAGWAALCAQARQARPADDWEIRLWLMKHLQPWRVESLEGQAEGLVTGYFEPQLEARRQAQAGFRVPLLAPPQDLARRRPYLTRQQIEVEAAAQLARHGAPRHQDARGGGPLFESLAWVEDPLDALVMHIQGSGRLRITEPDGSSRWVRLAFAGHNDQPYRSVGRWLLDQGELRPGEASWPGIKDWARRNPQRLREMLGANPRYVFFREEPLPDLAVGPRGAQGVPLTPGRSIAVDRASIPYGTPVWLDSTEPLSSTPLRRLVMAQDTGSAIVGAVRADFFWGWGSEAEAQAGRMKQPLRLWALWPRDNAL